ncbi:unnamed protein product, partial [Calicophoron daubneyi]
AHISAGPGASVTSNVICEPVVINGFHNLLTLEPKSFVPFSTPMALQSHWVKGSSNHFEKSGNAVKII